MMSNKNLLRSLMTRAFRLQPPRPIRAKRAGLGIEALEDRITPATTLSAAGGVLTIHVGAGETVNLNASLGHLVVSDAANVTDTTGLFTGSGTATATETNPLTTDFTAIVITGSAGTETVNFTGGAFVQTTANDGLIENVNFTATASSFSGTLAVNESAATNSQVTISKNLSVAGSAAISISTSGPIVVYGGATVSTVDGSLALSANAGAAATGNFTALTITGAGTTVTTSGSGGISLNGTGSDATGTGSRSGVLISAGATVSSTKATGGGGISISGAGASGAGGFDNGVLIAGAGTLVTSVSGGISIQGTGGADGGQASNGVDLRDGAQVRSTGTAPNAASILINGHGGGSAVTGRFEVGVSLDETGGVGPAGAANKTMVTSVDGAISIIGTGGTAGTTPSSNRGVVIAHGTSVTATGAGTVSLSGTATLTGAVGVLIASADLGDTTATTVNTNTGTLSITGSSAAGAAAIQFGDTTGTDASITAGAAVTLTGNGAGGGIALLDPITATGQLVTLTTANGSVTQPTTTAAVTAVAADRLNASASTGVGTLANPLTTAIANLQADSATGGVFVRNTGTVSIAGTGVKATTSGNIGLTAGGITVDNGTVVQAAGAGTITLDASLTGTGSVSLLNTSSTGAKVASASGAITITTGLDGTFTNDSGAAGGVTSTSGPITVNANTVTDKNPITTTGAVAINLTTSSATTGGAVAIGTSTADAVITGATVTITGTANPDTFTLAQDSGGTAVTLNAGNPAPFTTPGDVLTLPVGGGTNTPTGAGSGQVTGATGLPTITYTSIESVTSSTTSPTALIVDFTALGGAAASPITLVRTGTGGASLEVLANGTLVSVSDYASVGSITVTGSVAADTLVVDNSGGLINRTITYNGGLGADALVVQGDTGAGATVSATYTTGANVPPNGNSGSLAYTDGTNTETINFTGLAPVESLTPVASLTINDASASTTENIVAGPTSTGIDPILLATAPTYQVTFASPAAESIGWRNAATVTVNGTIGNDTVVVNLPTRVDAPAGAFSLTTLNVTPGSGADEIDVLATPTGVTTHIDTQVGNPDRTVIGGTFAAFNTGGGVLANILGAVSVTDGGGVGQLYVDDSGAAAGVTATVTATTIAVGATPAITYDSNMAVVQLALTAFGDTVNVTSTQSGTASGNNTVTTVFGNNGDDTVNVSSSAPTLTGNLAGIAGELDINTGTGVDTLNVSDLGGAANNNYDLSAGGGRTTLSEGASAFANIVYDANGTPGQLENFNFTGSSAGGNDYNLNVTTATVSTTVSDGDATTSGNSTFGIGGSNLSGQNNFLGYGGLDSFLINVNTSIGQNAVAGGTITGVTIDGGLGVGGAANDSNNRDKVTVNDNSAAARQLNFQYLATQGDLDIRAASAGNGLFGANGTGTLALQVRGTETLVHDHGANNDTVKVTGTGGGDVLTVGLLPNSTSAVVFRNGTPYLNAPPESTQPTPPNGLPGFAGGGGSTDLLIGGMAPSSGPASAAGLTLDAGGPAAHGRAVVYAASELPVSVPGATLDYFGFGTGNLLPGFGAGGAYDTIAASDSVVATTNSLLGGPLTTVHLVTASFVQAGPPLPTQPAGLTVNGGDEAGSVGGVADTITADLSTNFNIRVNGNLPFTSGAPSGDHLTVTSSGGSLTVSSDTGSPPNVTVTGSVFRVTFSSIESTSISATTVNVVGDNNNTAAQADTFVVTGTAQSAFDLVINGSPPIHFTGVDNLNVNGGALGGDNATTITPFATASQPWNINVNVDGGAAGADGNSLTYVAAPGVTNDTHVVVTNPQAGNIDAHGIGAAATDQVVQFSNIETVTVSDGPNAGAFGDTLAVDLANGTATDNVSFPFPAAPSPTNPQVVMTTGALLTPLLNLNLDTTGFRALTVNGGAGTVNYTVALDPTVTQLPVALTVNGGTGVGNTLTLIGRTTTGANLFTNVAGPNATSGTAVMTLGATVTPGNTSEVTYTGLQGPNFVGGGGTSADALNLTGAGALGVTGTGPGAGTAAVAGQSGITFRNFGTASAINLTGTGGPDTFTVSQPVGWGIPNVSVTEPLSSPAAALQLTGTANADTITYDPTAGAVSVDDGTGATGVTHYATTGISRFSVDGGAPTTAPGDTLTVSSFLPGNATVPSGTLGTVPQISYQNIEAVQVGPLPTAVDDGPLTVTAGTPAALDVIANDTVGLGSTPLNVVIVTAPAHGTVTVITTNPSHPTVVYTPDTSYFGTDSFTYNLVDGSGQVSPTPATVTLAVLAIAHTPTVTVTSPVTGPGATAIPLVITRALSPTRNGAEALAYQISGVPASATFNHGTNAGNGTWAFTQADLAGLTITVTGGPATLSLTVTATSSMPGLPPAQVGAPSSAIATAPLVVQVTSQDRFAVGTGFGGEPIVHVYSAETYQEVGSFTAYDPTFRGGVTVAAADLNGDGVQEIVTGPGAGGGPEVRVYDGQTFTLLGSFYAFDPTFRGGVTVAAGELNGKAVIVVSSGAGGGPVVRVFDGTTFTLLDSFYAYDPTFRGGVTVAVADLLGTGQGEIITGAGVGGGPNVRVFTEGGALLQSFYAYAPSFTGGVSVSAGDLHGAGYADIVTGTGLGGDGQLRVFDGKTDALTASASAFGSLSNGFTVNATHVGGASGKPIILAASGPDYGPTTVRVFNSSFADPLAELQPFGSDFIGGAYVG